MKNIANNINELVGICHTANIKAGWWSDIDTGESMIGKRNVNELLMLCVSELAEAMEGRRKNLMDDHIPSRPMFDVELADCIIRICDLAGSEGVDLGGAIVEKLEYNRHRADHKLENRLKANGKRF